MGTDKQRQGFKRQAGFLMVGMSIALLAAALLTIGAARTSLNTWKENIGAGLGNQLQTINEALAAYISANSASLIANTAIAMPAAVGGNVANIYVPTIAELKSLGYLNTAAQATPTAGTAYVINIAKPSGCTSGCTITGSVYLQDPIRGPDGKVSDIRLLGSAMNASKSNQIGFSLSNGVSATSTTIKGNGWSAANPDPSQRNGILYAISNFTYTPTASPADAKAQYWLSPATTSSKLPSSGNTLGDGRYVINTRKPYIWDGSSWIEAYSDLNRNLSIGNGSGKGGTDNVLSGYNAGYYNTSGSNNVFMGSETGRNNTEGSFNLFAGSAAGYFNTTGNNNIFMGNAAGRNNTAGSLNLFTGNTAGYFNTSGYNNVFTGSSAGYLNTSGYGNVFTGDSAGYSNLSGSYNTAYGALSGVNTSDLSNASAFGYNAKANASNSVRIGNTSVTSIGGAVAWTSASDRRLKTDILDTPRGLDFVLKLRPVDYLLKESKMHQTGFIAQEVEAIDANFPGVHKPVNDKDFYSLTYTDFIPALVKSIQELEARTANATQADALLQANVIRLMFALLALLTALVVWLVYQNQVMRRKLDLL